MDRYDDMLLKARAEMLGKEPLRKEPPHDALFSHVWESVVKAPMQMSPEQYERFQANQQASQQRRDQERQQQTQQRTQSSPQPIDPFGQMNDGASLDQPAPPTGMGANFRQGQSETRDPNKTGMFGRAKQGIGNLMNRFRRQPSQQTESTPPSLQEEQEPQGETRAFRDMPRAEYPPSFRMATADQRGEDGFPTRQSVVRNARAGSNDLAEWDRMNALREQREAETQQTQQAEQGNDLRAATRAKMTETPMPSPMQEAQDMTPPTAVEAGMEAMREPVDDNFYDRFAGVEEQPMRQPRPEAPAPVEEQREFVDPFGQMNGLEEREELPPDFNTEIEPQYSPAEHGDVMQPMEEYAEENPNWWDGIEGADVMEETPEADFEQINEQEERLTNPLPTGGKGVKGLLPDRSPRPVGEDRMLPESTGENKPGEMVGPPSKARTGFQNEINERSEADKAKQDPRARSGKDNRLMERKRREKMRNEKYNVMPEEQQEKAPPKKAAKKSPAAKAVKTTASKRKAKAKKPLEGTEEMREEAPPKKGASKVKETTSKAKPKKGAAKVEATTSKKAPKMEIGEGAERIEAKPKKGAANVKAKTSKAKPKKGSALASVNTVAEKRKAGKDPSKPFANKAKPARKRTKNPKKTAVKGLGDAALRSRERQAAKKNEPSEESAPEKEYGLSISGSASSDEISEIMEAARNGNKSAQSAIYNNAGTLEDAHGISAEDIQEASGR